MGIAMGGMPMVTADMLKKKKKPLAASSSGENTDEVSKLFPQLHSNLSNSSFVIWA